MRVSYLRVFLLIWGIGGKECGCGNYWVPLIVTKGWAPDEGLIGYEGVERGTERRDQEDDQ